MILSNLEIQNAIDAGRLVIDPQPSPRTLEEGPDCPYDTCAVDLRLAPQISVPKDGPFVIDLVKKRGSLAEFFSKHCDQLVLTDIQPLPLEPKQFVLARTIERVHFPMAKCRPYLAGRIEGKSSIARCGVLIHFTAPTIHTNFNGTITLEIINLGPATFMLRPSMPIGQLIVEEVQGEMMENTSQFQNQATPEGLPTKS